MIDRHSALQLVLAQRFDWGTESISLHRATGRVLRGEVRADRDQPPFDRVAMDGVSLNYAAYRTGQRRFPVSHLAPAGTAAKAVRDEKYCVEVMTGAPLPPGTTTVIRYEDLVREGENFLLPEGVEDGKSIHRRGSDGRAGDLILHAGVRIGPAELAALATYGRSLVEVSRLPRVAIASTGDEVVPVEETPLDHQIRSSNVYQLAGLFRAAGIEPTVSHLTDDAAAGPRVLQELLDGHDILLLSGGVSKGKLDHVPDWLAAAGVERLFHRVAQRPGKPLWVGRNAGTMVFALPGNPVSSLVGAVAYAGPWLRRQLGLADRTRVVRLAEDVDFKPGLTLFQSVSVDHSSGEALATPVRGSGSGDLVSLLRTDGFAELPAERSNFRRGERFPLVPLLLI